MSMMSRLSRCSTDNADDKFKTAPAGLDITLFPNTSLPLIVVAEYTMIHFDTPVRVFPHNQPQSTTNHTFPHMHAND